MSVDSFPPLTLSQKRQLVLDGHLRSRFWLSRPYVCGHYFDALTKGPVLICPLCVSGSNDNNDDNGCCEFVVAAENKIVDEVLRYLDFQNNFEFRGYEAKVFS